MANWVKDKVFNNADDFLSWLDKNFGSYISGHISENHVHHTWKPNHANNKANSTLQLHKNMRNFHVGTNGWVDIAQHITIGSDGRIVLGRNITQTPVSATNYNGNLNWHPFAYEMIGNFDKGNDVLEGKQLESAIKISRYFYSKNKPVKFHRELLLNGKQPKTCPGTGISKTWFMNLVQDSKFDVGKSVNTSKVSKSPASKVKSERIGTTSRNYLQKGDKSAAVKNMQNSLIKAGYSLPKFGADGHFGDESELAVKAMQKKNKLVVDGLFGQASSVALDKEIKDKTKTSSSTKTSKPKTNNGGKEIIKTIQKGLNSKYKSGLAVDGIDGKNTKKAIVKAYQTELNKQFGARLQVDGVWGSKSKNASATVKKGAKGNITWLIQARLYCLGYNPNGLDSVFGGGLETAVKAFQKKGGLEQDGIVGKNTFAKLFG